MRRTRQGWRGWLTGIGVGAAALGWVGCQGGGAVIEPAALGIDGLYGRASVELSNARVVVGIVPEIGRVMHFGPATGGGNAMWTRDASGDEGWKNWGGDKAWWWPQDEWWAIRGEAGKQWPPPSQMDGEPWELVAREGRRSVAIRSVADQVLGSRFERSFRVVGDEAAMVVTTTLVPVEGLERYRGLTQAGALPAWAVPWTVTQVPTDRPIYARLVEGATTGQVWMKPMMGETPMSVHPVGSGWVRIDRDKSEGRKLGVEADVLAVRLADGAWLVQRYLGSATGGSFEPAERAQVYQAGEYVELEFIGPSTGGPGPRSFELEWRLQDEPPFALE
ncbi:MAG: hypothetical protein AAFY08_06320 [Planctomycetota bacterium]